MVEEPRTRATNKNNHDFHPYPILLHMQNAKLCTHYTQQSSHRKFGGILSDIIRSDTLNENLRFDT